MATQVPSGGVFTYVKAKRESSSLKEIQCNMSLHLQLSGHNATMAVTMHRGSALVPELPSTNGGNKAQSDPSQFCVDNPALSDAQHLLA